MVTTTPHAPQGAPRPVRFWSIREESPGPQWRGLLTATWAAYRAWYLKEGDAARPSLAEGERMLRRHMPELSATWERLVDLADGDETAARMLTLWNPPAFLPGCSQAVLDSDPPVLVRNYDYHPDLCERVVLSSALTGRRVLGMSDCLWGLLDGTNDAGLAASLAFGGRRGVGEGFGIPLVMRYLLEMAESLDDAHDILSRVPVNMAYNITVLDGTGRAGTFFVAPGAGVELLPDRVATNHRGRIPEDREHARRFRSVERRERLVRSMETAAAPEGLVDHLLSPPLYNTSYATGFGTIYTAVYRPGDGTADYVWPGTRWRRSFGSPSSSVLVSLGAAGQPR